MFVVRDIGEDTVAEIARFVCGLGRDELLFAAKMIREKLAKTSEAPTGSAEVKIVRGSRVSVRMADATERSGTLMYIDGNIASFEDDEGKRWTVHPSFLKGSCAAAQVATDSIGKEGLVFAGLHICKD